MDPKLTLDLVCGNFLVVIRKNKPLALSSEILKHV